MTDAIKGDPEEIFKELSGMARDAAIAGADGQKVESVEDLMNVFDRRLAEVLSLLPNSEERLADGIGRELSDMAWDAAIAGADGQEARSVQAFKSMFEDRLAEILGLRPTADD